MVLTLQSRHTRLVAMRYSRQSKGFKADCKDSVCKIPRTFEHLRRQPSIRGTISAEVCLTAGWDVHCEGAFVVHGGGTHGTRSRVRVSWQGYLFSRAITDSKFTHSIQAASARRLEGPPEKSHLDLRCRLPKRVPRFLMWDSKNIEDEREDAYE